MSNPAATAPAPAPGPEITLAEPKPEATIQHNDTLHRTDSGRTATIAGDGADGADQGKAGKLLTNTAPKDGDLGRRWLDTYTGPRPELTDEANTRVRNQIDRSLLPLIFLIYFNQQQDKSSVAFSAVFGFREDTGMNTEQYAWLTTIIYIAQLCFQPLSVYALVRFKVNYWIVFCFIGWSSSCMILAAFTSFPGLLVFRFILGAFEASIAPTMMILVSGWWTRREQPLRNNLWYSANGIALCLGSLIAYGLGHIRDGQLYVYQYIFLVNGTIGLISVIPTYFFLPSHITTARFLTDENKYLALQRIRMNKTGTQNTQFQWPQVWECLLDPKQWVFAIMVFCVSMVSGGISAFGPLVISGFGYDNYQTILFNMIPGPIGIVANLIAAYFAQKYKRKAPVILGVLLVPVAAAAALYAMPREEGNIELNRQLLAIYFILQIFQPLTPVVFSWTFANTAGHTKKTTTTALLFVGLCVGNMVGPQLYLESEQPYYQTGLIANMIVLVAMFCLCIGQVFYLTYLNKRNVRRRIAAGKTGPHVDYSLENSNRWADMRAEKRAAAGGEDAKAMDGQMDDDEGGLDDKTDLKNEDFIYSL